MPSYVVHVSPLEVKRKDRQPAVITSRPTKYCTQRQCPWNQQSLYYLRQHLLLYNIDDWKRNRRTDVFTEFNPWHAVTLICAQSKSLVTLQNTLSCQFISCYLLKLEGVCVFWCFRGWFMVQDVLEAAVCTAVQLYCITLSGVSNT